MIHWYKLVMRNTQRQRLRSLLTILGIVIAILAFGVLQTIVDAWYTGVDGAVPSRLIVRNAISFTAPLPVTHYERIRSVNGVREASHVNWFGGIYKDSKNFFPQFAIQAQSYFNIYSEILISEQERLGFLNDRRGAIVGRKLADRYGFKIGDVIPLRGTIFPGNWEFVVRGIFEGRDPKTDTAQLLFHWEYLNENLRSRSKMQADQIGFVVVDAIHINKVDSLGLEIDALFKNSFAETLTETERAFQIGFVKQTEAILLSIRIVSFVVIFIILAVMANTMAMTASERTKEYATLKALGFGPVYIARLILGESVVLALIGGSLAIALTGPVAKQLASFSSTLFPTLVVSANTIFMQFFSALLVGIIAALAPIRMAFKVRIVDGLRSVN